MVIDTQISNIYYLYEQVYICHFEAKQFYLRVRFRIPREIYSSFLLNASSIVPSYIFIPKLVEAPSRIRSVNPWRATSHDMSNDACSCYRGGYGKSWLRVSPYIGSPTSCPQIRHPWGFLAQIPRLTWRNAHDSKY